MHCALLRRINIQNSEQLTTISINQNTNFISIGDSKGLLQVINFPQIEAQTVPISREESFSQKKNFFQPLNYHHNPIKIITWNTRFNKLTTVDESGMLIVWKEVNGLFESEMVNNREQSYIKDVKWSKNGEQIIFIYEDGQLYCGLVNGSNCWYNNLEGAQLSFVEYSPDDKKLLVSEICGKIYVFSEKGHQIAEMNLNDSLEHCEIISLEWWSNKKKYRNVTMPDNNNNNGQESLFSQEDNNIDRLFKKHLMIAFKNGTVLLLDDETDKNPLVINTELTNVINAQWQVDGLCFVVIGDLNDKINNNKSMSKSINKSMNNNNKSVAIFYNTDGEELLKVVCPTTIVSFSWGFSSTIAFEAQKCIYIGFIKYAYKWSFFCKTIVLALLISDKKYNIIYLDTVNNAKLNKLMYNVIDIISNDLYCVILCENKDETYNIIFTNNFGNILDSKKCPIKPIFYAMNDKYLVVSNGNYVYLLQFKGYSKKKTNDKNTSIASGIYAGVTNQLNNKLDPYSMHEIIFFIDEQNINMNIEFDYNKYMKGKHQQETNNAINAITLSTNYLFISRESGQVYRYDLDNIKADSKYKLEGEVKRIGISPFETYLWAIDKDDLLRIYNIKYPGLNNEVNIKLKKFLLKDVWELEWCHKNEDYVDNFEDSLNFVVIQKNKLIFYSNLEQESDAYICKNYLANYIDNEVVTVRIEKLIEEKNKDFIIGSDYLKIYQNYILNEFNNLFDTGKPLKDIYDYVTEHPNQKLWTTLSKKALENLDFDTAQKTMLQLGDFAGLEFIKQAKTIEDPELLKAEIAEFNSNYDDASKLYNKNNRSDLNLAMQMKLGKWDKVTEIMNKSNLNKSSQAFDDNIKMAYSNYGDELFERKDYDKALENYEKSGNIKGIINTHFAKENYENAAKMLDVIPEEDEFLEEMGNKFNEIGMCDEAVKAYIKHGNIQKALQTYIKNNKWEEAIGLSADNDFIYMEDLIKKFSDNFKKSGHKIDLVNLYKKANMSAEVYKHLIEVAEDMQKIKLSPLIIKKIYVLAALELERYKAQINEQIHEESLMLDQNNNINVNKIEIKKNYIAEALAKEIDKKINNYWRGAEAYHYYMLCQVQLYRKQFKESCKTVIRLKLYEDILGTETVYRLIGLCSYLNKCFRICSEALCILENDKSINKHRRLRYKELSDSIFVKISPENIDEKFYKCPNSNCDEPISEYDVYCNECGFVLYGCVLTGQSILDNHYFKCKQCRNKTITFEVKKHPFKHCPLCHVSLIEKKKDG